MGCSGHAPRTSSSSDDSKRSPLVKTPLGRPAAPRFGKPDGLRGRGLGSPEPGPTAPYLGRSMSYSSQKAPAGISEAEEVALQPLLTPKDEVQLKTAYSKSNGQPKSIGSASPGPGQQPLSSPTRGGVKRCQGWVVPPMRFPCEPSAPPFPPRLCAYTKGPQVATFLSSRGSLPLHGHFFKPPIPRG